MKKKYRIYRGANKTWWVDSIIPGLDTLWVSDYRIIPVFRGLGVEWPPMDAHGLLNVVSGGRDGFRVERWDHDRNGWSLMSESKTWLDAIRLVAYRERQVAQSTEDQVHHLEACS